MASIDFYDHHAFARETKPKRALRWDRIAIFAVLLVFHGAWIYGLAALVS